MTIRNFVLAATLALVPSVAFAQPVKVPDNKTTSERSGTAEDQAACRPDVRRFCHKIESDAGDMAFLACLKEHREKLRKSCLAVLEKNGQ